MITRHRAADVVAALFTRSYVNGVFLPSAPDAVFDVLDPTTGQVLARVTEATAADADAAVDAATQAQRSWSVATLRHRADLLSRLHDAVLGRLDDFASVITAEMGKPLDQARGEVRYAAGFLRWYAEEAPRIAGRFGASPDGDGQMLTQRLPVGVSLLITPWNFPLAMLTRKIGPALAAGCTTIVKPAEATPLTALLLADVIDRCGFPPGVVNVLTTSQPGEMVRRMIASGQVRKVSFTGSTPVGRRLLSQAAEPVLRTSMELGGNAPFIVRHDADLEAALDGAMIAKMRNMGQSCVAANRFLVHASVAGAFTEQLAARMAVLRVASGFDEGAEVGALIDEAACQRIQHRIDTAVGDGATIVTGGVRPEGPGAFFPPTVLADVPATSPLMREETFGPVAPVVAFDDDDEALALANSTEHGLVAYLYSRDVKEALQLTRRLECGIVGLNRGYISNPAAPFGGMKASGLGREGGSEGLSEYLETQYVAL